jgi:hypothetical protein
VVPGAGTAARSPRYPRSLNGRDASVAIAPGGRYGHLMDGVFAG